MHASMIQTHLLPGNHSEKLVDLSARSVPTMPNAYYYNFLPTKAEEVAEAAFRIPHQVTRTLVEVGALESSAMPASRRDPNKPMVVRKFVITYEFDNGILFISQQHMVEHVFRYWSPDKVNLVTSAEFCICHLIDRTNQEQLLQEKVVVMRRTDGHFIVAFMEVTRAQQLFRPGDEIALWWDIKTGTFCIKLLLPGQFIPLD